REPDRGNHFRPEPAGHLSLLLPREWQRGNDGREGAFDRSSGRRLIAERRHEPLSMNNSVFEDSVSTFLASVKAYLDDDSVSEVLVNGPSEIFVERRGKLERVDARFTDEQALQAAGRNIAQFVGRRIDDENPTLDARLPDGSRVAAVLPPCSRKGTTLSIRKFSKAAPTFVDLIQRGSITKDAARFLDVAIYLAKNMIVTGGTGSGKTTLLNVLGSRIPGHQRLLV